MPQIQSFITLKHPSFYYQLLIYWLYLKCSISEFRIILLKIVHIYSISSSYVIWRVKSPNKTCALPHRNEYVGIWHPVPLFLHILWYLRTINHVQLYHLQNTNNYDIIKENETTGVTLRIHMVPGLLYHM